jgi:hypothetical protein
MEAERSFLDAPTATVFAAVIGAAATVAVAYINARRPKETGEKNMATDAEALSPQAAPGQGLKRAVKDGFAYGLIFLGLFGITDAISETLLYPGYRSLSDFPMKFSVWAIPLCVGLWMVYRSVRAK